MSEDLNSPCLICSGILRLKQREAQVEDKQWDEEKEKETFKKNLRHFLYQEDSTGQSVNQSAKAIDKPKIHSRGKHK